MLIRGAEALSEILNLGESKATPAVADLFTPGSVNTTKSHETYRLELGDGLSVPNVIIPANCDVEDFFATVATYYASQSPLSALVHVLNEDTIGLFEKRNKKNITRIENSDHLFRRACLGAMVGESILAGRLAGDANNAISYAACRRTLAFSLCRTTILYGLQQRSSNVADRWTRLRKLTGLSSSSATTEAILLVHEYAVGSDPSKKSMRVPRSLSKALAEVAQGGVGDGSRLAEVFAELYPATNRHLGDMKGPFDGRMVAFTKLIEAIELASNGTFVDEIAISYFCNQILPGSFIHSGILANLVEHYPSALIWYGFFSLLSSQSFPQHASGLLLKLERDLQEGFSFEQRPRCDISLEELEVLSRASLRAEMIRPSQQRALFVSLLPGVDVYTRFGSESDNAGNERARRDFENDEMNSRLSKLLEEALYLLKKGRSGSRGTTSNQGLRFEKDR